MAHLKCLRKKIWTLHGNPKLAAWPLYYYQIKFDLSSLLLFCEHSTAMKRFYFIKLILWSWSREWLSNIHQTRWIRHMPSILHTLPIDTFNRIRMIYILCIRWICVVLQTISSSNGFANKITTQASSVDGSNDYFAC